MKVAQLCPTLRPHGLYSPWNSPGQNTGVVAFPFSRGSSHPRDRTQVSHIAGGLGASLIAQLVKNLLAMQETLV